YVCFNDTATTEIYTLSLHDALPISAEPGTWVRHTQHTQHAHTPSHTHTHTRSEEHTSELQSHLHLVCRLLLDQSVCGGYGAGARLLEVPWWLVCACVAVS